MRVGRSRCDNVGLVYWENAMGKIEKKLAAMGLLPLPAPHPYPKPNRTACVRVGNMLYLSGHGTGRREMPLGIKPFGKVGMDVTEEDAYLCARAVALTMMGTLKAEVGDLDRVKRVVRLYGMVNGAPGFDRPFAVVDGASDLFYELWGPEYGRHARAAVGIAELPRGAVVEIMGEFELWDEPSGAAKAKRARTKRKAGHARGRRAGRGGRRAR
jgi:enamine deaminase RidA (YjgF/YER057c/UK114 family)